MYLKVLCKDFFFFFLSKKFGLLWCLTFFKNLNQLAKRYHLLHMNSE